VWERAAPLRPDERADYADAARPLQPTAPEGKTA